ncbi:MAG: hypothetical protein AB8G05_26680 [Oligoflexales bacterium]
MNKLLFIFLISLLASVAFSNTENRKPILTQKEKLEARFGPFKISLEQVKISSQIEQNNPDGLQNFIKSEIFLNEIMVTIGQAEIVNTMVPGIKTTCQNIKIDLRGHRDLFIKLQVNAEFKTPTQIELNIEDIKLNLAKDYVAKNSVGVCRGLFNLRDPILERLLNHSLKKGMGGFNILGNIILENFHQNTAS